MYKAEDKTFNTIRTLSDRRAINNQGSITSTGGMYIGKNIICKEDILANLLIIENLAKFAGDISVGGNIYCPNLFTFDNENIYFHKKIHLPNDTSTYYPNNNNEPSLNNSNNTHRSIGTKEKPLPIIYCDCLKTNNLDITKLSIATNVSNNPSLVVEDNNININDNLNIINPTNNTVMVRSYDGKLETFVPIYNQWNSFSAIEIDYNPDDILHINASHIILNIKPEIKEIKDNDIKGVILNYDGNLIPDSTKVKIYFIQNQKSSKFNYKLTLYRSNKRFIFTSKQAVKKIKLIFLGENVYLAN